MNQLDKTSQHAPRSGSWCTTLTLCLLLLPFGAVLANDQLDPGQDPDTDTAVQLDRVVVSAPNYVPESSVSASKSAIPLVEIPQSVSVVTRDQIDILQLSDVQQAVRYTAGIVGENYGPDLRFDFLTLRGFTPKQYIDGLQAPITTSIFNVGADLYGFQEVDVLKGPAAILYGNSPPGGIYNLVSRRAESTYSGEVGVIFGSHDDRQLRGTVTGPLNEQLDGRFTFLQRDRESQTDHVRARRTYVAPTFTWRIGDATSLTGLFYHQRDRNTGDTNGFLPAAGTRLGNPNGTIPRGQNLGEPDYNSYDRDQTSVGWELTHDFDDTLAFTQNAKWYRYKELQHVIYGAGLQDDLRTVNRSVFPFAEKVTGYAIDNRFAKSLETAWGSHNLLAGLDYRRLVNDAKFGFGIGDPIDAFNPIYGAAPVITPPIDIGFNDQRVSQVGLYLQDYVKVGQFVTTLNLRHDRMQLQNRADSTTTKQQKTSYRLGFDYVFAGGWVPYISHATSFEPIIGSDSETGENFKPSTSAQTEFGIKYDGRNLARGVDLFASGAIYNIRQENLVSVQSGMTPMFGRQIGEVEAQGLELELVARIHEQLSINASYTYTDTEVIRDASGYATGAPLPTTPKNKLAGLVDYTFQDGKLAGFGFGFGGRYLSKSAGALVDAFTPSVIYSKSTTIWDGLIHYDTLDWRLSLTASNLFDKAYVGRCSNMDNCIYGAGRVVMFAATWKL